MKHMICKDNHDMKMAAPADKANKYISNHQVVFQIKCLEYKSSETLEFIKANE